MVFESTTASKWRIEEQKMPGVVLTSLCDEALTFDHDQTLLGFCLDDLNEPDGDDYDSRLRRKWNGEKVDPYQGYTTEDVTAEMFVESDGDEAANDEEAGDSYKNDDEELYGSSSFQSFCRMSHREQEREIARMKIVITQLICVSPEAWLPSESFVLDAIQDDLPSDLLREKTLAVYHFSHLESDFDRYGSDEDDDVLQFSQHGGWESRRPGLYESTGGASLWVDREGRWHGEDSHGKFWVLENEEHQTRKKAREGFHHFERRSRTHNDRRETIRTNAPHYFGFAGKGDGFDEYVDSYEAFGEPEVVPETVPNHWVPDPWWEDKYELNEALRDMEWWKENRHSLFHSRVRRVRRPGSFWEDWDDLYYDDYRCAYVEQDHREGYLFEDYHGPDNPMTGEDDPLDHLDHFDYLCVSHGTRVLIRFGTPRQQLRMAG